MSLNYSSFENVELSPERISTTEIDAVLERLYGAKTFQLPSIQESLPYLQKVYAAISLRELGALYGALQSEVPFSPSEEALNALFETVLNPADAQGFFLRFLEAQAPKLHQIARAPGGIRVNLLPEDIPWEIYKKYFARRLAGQVRRQEEADQPKRHRAMVLEHLSHYKSNVLSTLDVSDPEQQHQQFLELTLLESLTVGKKVNEGNNGVIYLVDVNDFSNEGREIAYASGLFEKETQSAIKILKVYVPDGGRGEAYNQLAIRQILDAAKRDGVPTGTAPEIYANHTITLQSEDLQRAFRSITGIASLGEKVSCLAMEYVKGEDLATYIWRAYGRAFIRKVISWDKEGATGIDESWLTFLDRPNTFFAVKEYIHALQKRASPLRGLVPSILEEMSKAEMEADPIKAQRIDNKNRSRISELLHQDGFTIDPSIYQKILRAINTFRKAGVVLLDGHERNIMLTDEELYFIDFEKCKWVGRPVQNDHDQSAFFDATMNPNSIPVDKQILHFLEPFLPK